MDTEVVLDTIPDKECAAFLEHPEETADKVQQHVSSDSILTGPQVTSKMRLQGNIQTFDKKGQEAVTKLFGHLQDTHNHMAQVAQAVVYLSKVSSPEQFTFVLQLAVRPIIQLKIPPHLSAPTELKFDKERLTPEEITEENCCNLLLTRPFHPKFSTIAFKHPTRCLAAAMNNNSHKTSPSMNNNHKACPPLNNNHKVMHPLILNRNLFHHNSAMMTNFQIHLPLPQKLLPQKILDLYQINQNIVYDQKHSTFNPLYLCFIFSLQIKENKLHTRQTHLL